MPNIQILRNFFKLASFAKVIGVKRSREVFSVLINVCSKDCAPTVLFGNFGEMKTFLGPFAFFCTLTIFSGKMFIPQKGSRYDVLLYFRRENVLLVYSCVAGYRMLWILLSNSSRQQHT